jgi:hypothetical protein
VAIWFVDAKAKDDKEGAWYWGYVKEVIVPLKKYLVTFDEEADAVVVDYAPEDKTWKLFKG